MLRTKSLRYSDGHASPKEAAKCFLLYPAGNAPYRLFEFTAVYFFTQGKGFTTSVLAMDDMFCTVVYIKSENF